MKEVLSKLVVGQDLQASEVEAAMEAILSGQASPAQIAGFAVGLRAKGETAEELAAAARVMRAHAVPVKVTAKPPVIDTCGTGGDRSGSFNISTTSAIVVAACGVTVAKHGNRAATSKAGSADVLEALGVDIELPPERIGTCIDQVGIGFMFARAHHPAMRHAAPVRAELGIPTLFNFLGPLSNPAGVTHQLLGVGDPDKLETMAQVLALLGCQGAWVVHGHGAMDEVTLSGPTRVAAIRGDAVERFEVSPSDFGVGQAPASALAGGDASDNAAILKAILAGEPGPRRDAVIVNAAAALCAAGVAASPAAAAERAAAAIDSGAARDKLAAWVGFGR